MYTLDTISGQDGLDANIVYDETPQNPREAFSQLGTILAGKHRRYSLGDPETPAFESEKEMLEFALRQADIDTEEKEFYFLEDRLGELLDYETSTLEDVEKAEQKVREEYRDWLSEKASEHLVMLPVYIYEHSAVQLRTKPFRSAWDSGQIGFIFTTKKRAREEYGSREDPVEAAKECLRSEIEEYSSYVNGDVYGYRLNGIESREPGDSCYGFYDLDHCKSEATRALKARAQA